MSSWVQYPEYPEYNCTGGSRKHKTETSPELLWLSYVSTCAGSRAQHSARGGRKRGGCGTVSDTEQPSTHVKYQLSISLSLSRVSRTCREGQAHDFSPQGALFSGWAEKPHVTHHLALHSASSHPAVTWHCLYYSAMSLLCPAQMPPASKKALWDVSSAGVTLFPSHQIYGKYLTEINGAFSLKPGSAFN